MATTDVDKSRHDATMSVIVLGASGDLARKKIFPALFALYCQDYLPSGFSIFGFARTPFGTDDFRSAVMEHLTCRYVPDESCDQRMAEFLERCHYVRGSYDSPDSFLDLYQRMRTVENDAAAERLYYLAVPSTAIVDIARAMGSAGLVSCGQDEPWTRVVIEKPFGRDRESSDVLIRELAQVFTDDQVYRIDHYLGKEVIQNLHVLRFANLIFEPLWCRDFIRGVEISWQEEIGVEGRGRYFDAYGIIRDVMQNHLLQILALTAMEPPATLDAAHVRDEKVRLLRCVPPPDLADVVLGQYEEGTRRGRTVPGYIADDTVASDSLTPTFASVALRIENSRWRGVPFLLRAGKGLDARRTEIRIRFREMPHNVFCELGCCPDANELVIRVQPDETIYFRIVSKVPGAEMAMASRKLDLRYESAFHETIPDAYEALLVDVMHGEKSLFIRSDELAAAWDIFTPVLHEIDRQEVRPESYPLGSHGPAAADALAARFGAEWSCGRAQ